MGHSAHEAEPLKEIAIDLEERFGFLRITRKSARGKNAALIRSVERRSAIGVSFGEGNTAIGNHAVDMIDRVGNELLKQIKRLLIAELVQPGPELVRRLNLFHADAARLRAGLEQPGTGNPGHEFSKTVVIEDVDEFGDKDAGFAGPRTHGQLVAEVAYGGEPHAGNAEMLAQSRDILHVEFIECDDAIDGMRPGCVTYGVNQALQRKFLGHGKDFVDTFEGPVAVAKLFDGKEQDNASHCFAGARS